MRKNEILEYLFSFIYFQGSTFPFIDSTQICAAVAFNIKLTMTILKWRYKHKVYCWYYSDQKRWGNKIVLTFIFSYSVKTIKKQLTGTSVQVDIVIWTNFMKDIPLFSSLISKRRWCKYHGLRFLYLTLSTNRGL